MKRVIITGGSGFIGTNLISNLERNPSFEILNIDINEPKLAKHVCFWKAVDIRSEEILQETVLNFNPNLVIHLAARTDLNGKSLEDYNSNTLGVSNLLKVLKKLNNLEMVVFTSSMLVCKPGYVPNNFTDYSPSTIYGESKVITERIIRNDNPNYNWIIVRPTSIWGPWFGEPYRNFFDMVKARTYFHIGRNSPLKTYGFVHNLVYQLNAIMEAPVEQVKEKVFYLGDYEPTDIREWADEISRELGTKILTIPYFLIKLAAFGGDILKKVNLSFPMSSFRLKNMTTHNVVDLSSTKKIAPNLPFSRINGIKMTLDWLDE